MINTLLHWRRSSIGWTCSIYDSVVSNATVLQWIHHNVNGYYEFTVDPRGGDPCADILIADDRDAMLFKLQFETSNRINTCNR